MSLCSTSRLVSPLPLALLGVIAAIVGYQAGAVRPEPVPVAAPIAIATFDLEKTFNTIDEKKAADAELTRLAEDMKRQSDEQAKRLKAMETELQDLQAGTPRYKEVMEQATRATYEYQAQVEFFRTKLNMERARMMRTVYESIRTAAEQLAKERGLVAVLVDDSITPIPPGTEEEINRQISARRMVYTAPEVDVTDELISRMNNLFKVSQGAGTKP